MGLVRDADDGIAGLIFLDRAILLFWTHNIAHPGYQEISY